MKSHNVISVVTFDLYWQEDKPFFQSDAFIGLAIGVGAVGGTLILCCVLWKCFCSDVDKWTTAQREITP